MFSIVHTADGWVVCFDGSAVSEAFTSLLDARCWLSRYGGSIAVIPEQRPIVPRLVAV